MINCLSPQRTVVPLVEMRRGKSDFPIPVVCSRSIYPAGSKVAFGGTDSRNEIGFCRHQPLYY